MNAFNVCVVLSVICFCVFAKQQIAPRDRTVRSYRYQLPDLKCAWAYHSHRVSEDQVCDYDTVLSGHLYLGSVSCNGEELMRVLIRDDLSGDPDLVEMVGFVDGEVFEQEGEFSDFASDVEPLFYNDYEFDDFLFEDVVTSEWHGVECQKYVQGTQIDGGSHAKTIDALYVKDGFPIGLVDGTTEFNFTFTETVDLNVFVCDNSHQYSVPGVDEPPTRTLCSSGSSSSSKSYTERYSFPKLPCAWTFIGSKMSEESECHYKTVVSGHLLLEEIECAEGDLMKIVARDDLGTNETHVKVFGFVDDELYEDVDSFANYADLAVPRFYMEFPFDFMFEDKVSDKWYGVECQKYVRGIQVDGDSHAMTIDALYVKDDIPIGLIDGPAVFNFTFSKTADLNEFVFDKSYEFEDDRVYNPPNRTTCSSDPSTSSGDLNPSSSSRAIPAMVIAILFSVFFLIF